MCYVSLTYFVIGFDPSAKRSDLALLHSLGKCKKKAGLKISYVLNPFRTFPPNSTFTLVNQMASGLFRIVGRSIVIANTFGSFAQLVLILLGGFVISRGTYLCNFNQ